MQIPDQISLTDLDCTTEERIARLEAKVMELGDHLVTFAGHLETTSSNLNEVQKNLIKVVGVVDIIGKKTHPQLHEVE